MKGKRGWKLLLKNNILSLVVIVGLLTLGIVFAGDIIFTEGGGLEVSDDFNVSGNTTLYKGLIVNEDGGNNTFRVEGDTNENLIYVNASADTVSFGRAGVQDANPNTKVEINFEIDGLMGSSVWNNHSGLSAAARAIFHNGASVLGLEKYGKFYSGTGARQASYSGIIDSGKGIHLGAAHPYGTGTIGFYTGGIDAENERVRIDKDGNVGIGTATPGYPLEVNGDTSGISIYASKNISATGYITRTSVYDKSDGGALDHVKDADALKTSGEIDHSKFYGYTTYKVTDFSRPEVVQECGVDEESGEEYCGDVTVYPYTKTEEGVSLNSEIDVLRQAVYELKLENEDLKNRVAVLEGK